MSVTVVITTVLVSMYVPMAGGVNCDQDCSTMATGIEPFIGAAACDAQYLYEYFELAYAPDGFPTIFQCLDTGGAVRGNLVDLVYVPQEGESVADALAFAMEWGRREVTLTDFIGSFEATDNGDNCTNELPGAEQKLSELIGGELVTGVNIEDLQNTQQGNRNSGPHGLGLVPLFQVPVHSSYLLLNRVTIQ